MKTHVRSARWLIAIMLACLGVLVAPPAARAACPNDEEACAKDPEKCVGAVGTLLADLHATTAQRHALRYPDVFAARKDSAHAIGDLKAAVKEAARLDAEAKKPGNSDPDAAKKAEAAKAGAVKLAHEAYAAACVVSDKVTKILSEVCELACTTERTTACATDLSRARTSATRRLQEKMKRLDAQLAASHPKYKVSTMRAMADVAQLRAAMQTISTIAPDDTDLSRNAYNDACNSAREAAPRGDADVQSVSAWDQQVEPLCASCRTDSTFCLEATTGAPFCQLTSDIVTRGPPSPMEGGTTLTLKIIGLEDKKGEFTITSANTVLHDSVTAPADQGGGAANSERLLEGSLAPENPPQFKQIKGDQSVAVPSGNTVLSLTVKYVWTPSETGSQPATREYKIEVNHGRYYLEIGLLVPVVFAGSRTVTATPIAGTGGEQRLTVKEDTIVSPALALNVFFLGRRNGHVWAFDSPGHAGDSFGLQLAVDINLKSPFDRMYGGLFLSPISGVSVSAGVAGVKADFVPQTFASGMLVPAGTTFTPDSKYMVRPYMGVTVTNEIITAITQAVSKINAQKPGG